MKDWSNETETAPGGRPLRCIVFASSIPWIVSAKAAATDDSSSVYVLEAEQLGECIANGVLIKSVQAAQDAAGLK